MTDNEDRVQKAAEAFLEARKRFLEELDERRAAGDTTRYVWESFSDHYHDWCETYVRDFSCEEHQRLWGLTRKRHLKRL